MKYRNIKTSYDGHLFDSKHEMRRYIELRLLERAKEISSLELQKVFPLIPAQYEESGEVYKKGAKKGLAKPGRCIEKPVVYKADFVYKDKHGNTVVEDAKGVKTKEYIIKRKLMLWLYKIKISEV